MSKFLLELHNKLDVYTPNLREIAAKHRVKIADLVKQLRKGIRVEMEHTTDASVAREIALDHLNERPDYYDQLDKVENT